MNTEENKKPETVENFYTADTGYTPGEEDQAASNTPIKKPKRGLAIAILALVGIFILVGLFSVFLFLSAQGSGDSLIGASQNSILNFVLLGLGITFAVGALVSLIVFVASLFKFMTASNSQPDKKRVYFKRLLIALIMLILTSSISAVSLIYSDGEFGGEIQESGIITTPEVVTGLSAPVSIQFDASQLPIDLVKYKVVSYRWDFGDGETANGPMVEHEFKVKPDSGFYIVQLRVNVQENSNPQAEIQAYEFSKTIGIDNQKVTPVITVDPDKGRAPLTVEFDASDSVDPDGNIISYEWDFNGDEITDEEGATVEYTFEEEGTYEVKLYLVDSNGETVTGTTEVTVLDTEIIQGVIRNVPEDEILTPERNYTFDASTSVSDEGSIDSFEWDFGDGQIRTGNKVSYSFSEEGVYIVKLRLNDSAGNELTVEKEYIVSNSSSGLFAKVQTTPELPTGQAPLKVSFDAGSSSGANIVEYKWDFENDGVIDDNGQIVEHVFTESGEYEVKLTINSSDGKTASKLVNVSVGGKGINPVVTATPNVGQVPLTVEFDATATKEASDSNIVSFRWDFGDGTPIRKGLPVMTHRYDRVGDFTVTVTAITDKNEVASTEVLVFVNPVPLQACFDTSRDSGTDEVTVSFDPSCTTGPATKFNWDFGDGETSIERKPVHTFVGTGEYTVQLEVVSNENDISVFEKTIVVE
jgi:PKD repeat protein